MLKFSVVLCTISALTTTVCAHDGRRLEIKVVDNQLVAHGYVSNGVDDGGGLVRPYYNTIHGHWAFDPTPGVVAASADLPGFDLFDSGVLAGHSLELTVVGATKWVSPPMMLDGHVIPTLVAADASDEIYVSWDGEFVSTEMPGTLTITNSVPGPGLTDIDLTYDILNEPTGVIFAIECRLSTDAPGIAASDPVYILLSPDGATPMEKLHHQSLHLEKFMGTRVCPGDANGDLRSDVDDLNTLLASWGEDVGAASFADLANGDGVIDVDDLNALLANFGADCS